MQTEPRLKSSLIVLLLVLLTAFAPRASAQGLTIASGSDLGTWSIGPMDGYGLTATGGTAPYTWSLVSGTLPPGISIRTDLPSFLVGSSASAAIAGVAMTPAVWNFRIRVTDAAFNVAEQDVTIRITSLVLKDNFALPNGHTNQPYSYTLTALRNGLPVTANWVTVGGVPPNMTLNQTTGELAGTPTASNYYNVQFKVQEGGEEISVTRNLPIDDINITTDPPGILPQGYLPNATQGFLYTTSLTATGGIGTKTFESAGLPSGLVMDSAGNISGTVTTRGTYSFSVTATDANHVSYARRFSLSVVGTPPAPPVLSTSGGSIDDCTYGWPCGRLINLSSGGSGPFTWSATGLPAGMSIRNVLESVGATPSDGELWGTPTQLGTYNVVVTVTDATGASTTQTFPLKVAELIMLNNAGPTPVPWTRNSFSTHTLRVLGGTSYPAADGNAVDGGTLYSVVLVDGVLPAGITMTAAPPSFSGTPLENASTPPHIRFTSSGGLQLNTSYFFSVLNEGTSTLQITSGSNLGTVRTDDTTYSIPLFSCCTSNTVTWSVVSGVLPPGLAVTSGTGSTGTLSRTSVDNTGFRGTYTFILRAADGTNIAQKQFQITVSNTSINTSSLPTGNVGTFYSQTLTANVSGTWTLSALNYLPPGLSLSTAGVLSGTPLHAGQYLFTVSLVAGAGTSSKSFTLTIYPAGVNPPINFSLGPYTFNLGTVVQQLSGSPTGGSGTGYVYSYSPGATPVPGLRVQQGGVLPTSLTAGSPAFLGVATTTGVHVTSIRVTDSAGNFTDKAVTVTVSPVLIVTPTQVPRATKNVFYSFGMTATGGAGYSWSATGLPTGLSIVPSTGVIQGTCTTCVAQPYTVGITATDLATSRTHSVNLTLIVNPWDITTGGVLPQGVVGASYSQTLSAPGCTPVSPNLTCSWTLTGGTLPTGVTLSTAGVLAHPTTLSAIFNGGFTVQVSGSNGTVQKPFSLQVVNSTLQLVQITGPTSPSYFTIGSPITSVMSAQGGVPPYTWSVDSGALPPGLSIGLGELIASNLNPGFNYIWGRGTQTGVYNFTLRANDSSGLSATRAFVWTIAELSNSYGTLPTSGTLTVGTPYTGSLLVLGGTALNGTGNYTFVNTTPLPFGLSLNPLTGAITGTPTEAGSTGTSTNLTVSFLATDNGNGAKLAFNVNFSFASTPTLNFNNGSNLGVVQQGSPYSQALTINNASGPVTVTVVTPATLPPGISLIGGSGILQGATTQYVLAGQPLASGVFTFTLQVQDSVATRQRTFFLSVSRITQAFSTTLPDGAVGEPYSQPLVTFNNSGSTVWTVANGFSLPPGLSLVGNTIAGTPTVANNSYSFALEVTDPTDPSGLVRQVTFTLRISSIRITSPQIIPVTAIFGRPFSYTFTATGGVVSWSAGPLPSSSLNFSSSGVLSSTEFGTSGTFTVLITATPASGVPEQRRFTLIATNPNPALLSFSPASAALADVMVGQAFATSLVPSGGVPPYTWTVPSGSTLPPGLVLVPMSTYGSPAASGFGGVSPAVAATLLTGAVPTAGPYTFDLVVSDSLGAQVRRTFTLKVSAVGIVAQTVAGVAAGTAKNGTATVAYEQQFTPVGGTAPFTFTMTPVSLTQDMLPVGFSMSPAGLVSGTTNDTGAYAFFLQVQDGAGNTFVRRTTLNVGNSTTGLFISNANPTDKTLGVGRGFQTMTLGSTNTAANSTYTWSLVSGALPPGIDFYTGAPWVETPNTTIIAGQPTTKGTFTYRLRATDNGNPVNWAEHTFTSRVAAAQFVAPPTEAFITQDLPQAQVGVPYTTTLRVAGGTPPYTFVESPFNPLPPEFTLSSSGVLSGTAQYATSFNIAPIVTDSTGMVRNGPALGLQVAAAGAAAPLIQSTTVELNYPSVGVPYNFPLDTLLRGGAAPFTWNVESGSTLPPGLMLHPGANGVSTYLSGVPTQASVNDEFRFSLEAHDAVGQSLSIPIAVWVSHLVLTPETLPPGRVGVPYSASIFVSGGGAAGTTLTPILMDPTLDFTPGLSLNPVTGVISGTPTTAGNFPMLLGVQQLNGSNEPIDEVAKIYRLAIDNPPTLNEAPAVSLSPTPVQVFYTTGGPNPAPTPVNINATSGTFPFGLSIVGVPGATVSTGTGTAPAIVNIDWALSGVAVGTYNGVLGVRADSVNLLDQVPVTLVVSAPPPCSYSVNPTSGSIGASGGAAGFGVTAGNGCAWTASSNAAWATVDAPASGSGSGTVNLSVAANPDPAPRVATIDVQGALYSLTQFGSNCSFSLNPASLSATAAGGSAAVNITASSSLCGWTATGLSANPASGTGNGTVLVTVPANPNAFPIVQTATIATSAGLNFSVDFNVTQAGINCTVGIAPYEAGSPSGGGSGSVTVTPLAGCSYDTVVGPSWVSVTSGGSGVGNGSSATLVYDVQPNSTTLQRSGTLTIGGQLFQITQEGVPCSVTLDTSSLGSPYGPNPGNVGSVNVQTNGPNCSWVAGSAASWATLSPVSGVGDRTINVTVQSNASVTTPRNTDLTIAGQVLSITQAGTVCTYALQSSTGSVPASGSVGTVGVVAPGACGWTALSNVPPPSWLSIVSSGSAGSANVLFSVLPQAPGAPARVGTLTIATKVFTVTQAAAPCTYGLPSGQSVPSAGTTGASFTYTGGGASCTPTATSFADWVTVTNTGPASVVFNVAENPTAATRKGVIQLGDKTFTVTQNAAPCGYSLHAYGQAFTQAGGSSAVLATSSTAACTPDYGTSQPFFITLGALSGDSSLFTLPFTVANFPSLNVNVRYGIITFGGRVFTVKQTSW